MGWLVKLSSLLYWFEITPVAVIVSLLVPVSVLLNVLHQVLLRTDSEPPIVFHWIPFLGSNITYGIDPPRFFQDNRAKIGLVSHSFGYRVWSVNGPLEVRRYLYVHLAWTENNSVPRNSRK